MHGVLGDLDIRVVRPRVVCSTVTGCRAAQMRTHALLRSISAIPYHSFSIFCMVVCLELISPVLHCAWTLFQCRP
jgi:hypothetical protein